VAGGEVDVDKLFYQGWTVFGTTSFIPTPRFGENNLSIYGFNGATNKWFSPPNTGEYSDPTFATTQFGRAYYVASRMEKTVALPFRPLPTNNFTLTAGWNLLYNIGEKSLDNLNLVYNGQTRTAEQMIAANQIKPNIYIIENERASESCSYFSILADVPIPADCTVGRKASVASIASGKAFWVYVN
jgi:hypothetical protein